MMLMVTAIAQGQNTQLINWFAGADLVGISNSEAEQGSNFVVREFELSANSQIDHTWEGTLTLSMHQEPDSMHEPHPEIHEAFMYSNQVISNTTLKVGRFFLGFGRLNRFHRHDWAITEAPLYHQEFFGSEAVKDNGVELSKILTNSFYLKLTMGLTTGHTFKDEHDHEEDEEHGKAFRPTHYLRLSSFKEFTSQKGFEYGLNYIGRADSEGNSFRYAGLDLIYKNKMGRFYRDLLQLEFWHRHTNPTASETNEEAMGAYAYYERGFDQNHALGIRLDWYQNKAHHEEATEHDHSVEVDDNFYELGVIYSYYNSEFMRTRTTLSHSQGLIEDEDKLNNTKFILQLVFMIGAHPAHLY